MKRFDEYLYKYGLHDCTIDQLFCENEKIIFCFDSGIYELNVSGVETTLTKSCKMIIEIDKFISQNICQHIEINQISKKRFSEISCEKFAKIVNKFKFDIDMHYYSYFCNTILLKGSANNQDYEILISEVKQVLFRFDWKLQQTNTLQTESFNPFKAIANWITSLFN